VWPAATRANVHKTFFSSLPKIFANEKQTMRQNSTYFCPETVIFDSGAKIQNREKQRLARMDVQM
jgi:hypothetical protein